MSDDRKNALKKAMKHTELPTKTGDYTRAHQCISFIDDMNRHLEIADTSKFRLEDIEDIKTIIKESLDAVKAEKAREAEKKPKALTSSTDPSDEGTDNASNTDDENVAS